MPGIRVEAKVGRWFPWQAHINRIGTAVPQHDVHQTFIGFIDHFLPERKDRLIFRRMVQRSGIEHRYSTLTPVRTGGRPRRLFQPGQFAGTAARMQRFETQAVDLAQQAIEALDLQEELALVTHMVVASCTGFTAPGLDQQIMERLGLNPSIERTMVGFMGCAAAVNALKVAHHIVGPSRPPRFWSSIWNSARSTFRRPPTLR